MFKFIPATDEAREDGFTLIELLAVILIIGILAAIAIPAFLNQRREAVDSMVKADVTNAGKALAAEALKGKNLTETKMVSSEGVLNASGELEMFQRVSTAGLDLSLLQPSKGTTFIIQPSHIDGGLCVFGVNPGGNIAATSPGFVYDSLDGGLLKEGSTEAVACGDGNGTLTVPEAHIERVLQGNAIPDREDPPLYEPENPSQGGSGDGTTISYSGVLVSNSGQCYLRGSEYDFHAVIDYDREAIDWQIDPKGNNFPTDEVSLVFSNSGSVYATTDFTAGSTSGTAMTNGHTDLTFNGINSTVTSWDISPYYFNFAPDEGAPGYRPFTSPC